MYRVWDMMNEERRKTVLSDAETWLARMDAGETV